MKEWSGRGQEGTQSRPIPYGSFNEDDYISKDSDNNESDDEDEVNSEHEYKIPPRVGMPALLVKFDEWLGSPDGGKRDEKL